MALISIRELLGKSWQQFSRDWRAFAKVAVWFLLIPAFMGFRLLIQYGTGEALQSDSLSGATIMFALISILLFIISLIVNFVIGVMIPIRLLTLALKRDKEGSGKATSPHWDWSLFGSFVWIIILISVGAVLLPLLAAFSLGLIITIIGQMALPGHTTIFIISGCSLACIGFFITTIYLSNLFSFAPQLLIEDGKRGRAALSASAKLVSRRWWKVFWRQVVPGLIFSLIIVGILIALALIVGLIGLIVSSITHASIINMAPWLLIPFGGVVVLILPYVIQVCLSSYLIVCNAKLFHSLKSAK